jgi:predicted GNAT family N-acyltransferase
MQVRFEERSAMDLRPLRFLVLWPHKGSVEECLLEADFLPTTRHFAAVNDHQEVVACCTVMSDSRDIDGENYPLRLRAMASHPMVRGLGMAKGLLAFAAIQMGSQNMWCDARELAVPFYQKCGWQVKSDPYEIPIIGTHFLMVYSGDTKI